MSNAIQFNSDGTVFSMDGDILNKAVRPANSAPDSRSAGRTIQTRTGVLDTYQQHTGAQSAPSTTSVQLLAKTGLVKVGGYEVTPEVAAALAEVAPSLTADPSVKAMEAAKEADHAKDEEALRDSLNRHADDQLESYHQHVVGEVPQQSLISLMVYAQRGETPPAGLINNIARDMGETVDSALAKVNAVNAGVQRQFTNLATAMGLNPDRAADWLKDHRKDTSMAALQAHYMRRDVMSWKPLLDQYKAATGDGVKH
jgi:hypothetical protein